MDQKTTILFRDSNQMLSNKSLGLVLLILWLCLTNIQSKGQDISIFTQRITEGFLFNPSSAGVGPTYGLLSYRNNLTGVRGAPNNNYLSLSNPINYGRYGVGLNLIQDNSSLLKTTYVSGAFAYHMAISSEAMLSMGLSADLNSLRLGDDLLSLNNGGDVILNQYKTGVITPDFSTGLTLRTKFVNAGVAMSHLSTSWNETGAVNQFTRYLTVSITGLIPSSDGRGSLEPYINYRKFFQQDQILDLGVFYNFNNTLIAGLGSRNFSLASASLGITPMSGIFIGYSREQLLGNIGHYLGSTNEIVLRASIPDRNFANVPGKAKIPPMDFRKLMYINKKKPTQKKYYQRVKPSRRRR